MEFPKVNTDQCAIKLEKWATATSEISFILTIRDEDKMRSYQLMRRSDPESDWIAINALPVRVEKKDKETTLLRVPTSGLDPGIQYRLIITTRHDRADMVDFQAPEL